MAEKGRHDRKKKPFRIVPFIITAVIGVLIGSFLALCIMIGITAYRIGDINMDTLYDNIEQSSILYDIEGDHNAAACA